MDFDHSHNTALMLVALLADKTKKIIIFKPKFINFDSII